MAASASGSRSRTALLPKVTSRRFCHEKEDEEDEGYDVVVDDGDDDEDDADNDDYDDADDVDADDAEEEEPEEEDEKHDERIFFNTYHCWRAAANTSLPR
eukprot:1917226-Pyramimonas_sp.AAC.1